MLKREYQKFLDLVVLRSLNYFYFYFRVGIEILKKINIFIQKQALENSKKLETAHIRYHSMNQSSFIILRNYIGQTC